MRKIILCGLMGILFLSLLLVAGCSSSQTVVTKKSLQNETTQKTSELSSKEIEALEITIQDEFKAEATYQKVLDTFGEVRPFSNIILAEQKHSSSLAVLFEKYNLVVPKDEWYNKVPTFNSIQEACQAGVAAEIENAALYDELMSVIEHEDIAVVFQSLRDASEQKHLPAFERCS